MPKKTSDLQNIYSFYYLFALTKALKFSAVYDGKSNTIVKSQASQVPQWFGQNHEVITP